MYFISINSRFESKLLKYLFAFVVSIISVNCFQSDNDFRGRGLEFRYRRLHPYGRGHRFGYHRQPKYGFEPDFDGQYPLYGDNGRALETEYFVSGNLFGIDENEFETRMGKMSEQCEHKIKPELGQCVERATNKYNINVDTNILGVNDCLALWDLMCCATAITHRNCDSIDLSSLHRGFNDIQVLLETRVCGNTARSDVKCFNY